MYAGSEEPRPGRAPVPSLAVLLGGAVIVAFDLLFLLPPSVAADLSTPGHAATLVVVLAVMSRAASRSHGTVARARWLFVAALVLAAVGTGITAAYTAGGGNLPVPSVVDVFTLPALPIACVGFWLLPRRERGRDADLTMALDAAIAASALFFVAWLLVLKPVIHSSAAGGLAVGVRVSYPIEDALAAAILLSLFPNVRGDVRRLTALTASGMALIGICDLIFTRMWATHSLPAFGASDVFLEGGLVLISLGALAGPAVANRRHSLFSRHLSTVPVTLCVVVGLGYVGSGHRLALGDVVSPAFMIMALLNRHRLASRALTKAASANEKAALSDDLTGLPNRRAFLGWLEEHLGTPGVVPAAVVLLDLNGFKEINDAFGHQTGDDVLRQFASLLRSLEGPRLTARLGGDEFAAVFVTSDPEASAHLYAARVAGTHHIDSELHGNITLSCSAGIGISRPGDTLASQVLRRADLAMYAAKVDPSRPLRLFDRAVEAAASRKHLIASALEDAIDMGQMHLVYQPVYDMANGEVIGAEALLRWNHPLHGNLSPAEFIPVAEETGQIVAVGSWVLAEALGQMALWRSSGRHLPRLFVNISGRQFNPGLASRAAAILQRHGLPPSSLTLEITESQLTDAQARLTLQRLHDIGIRVAIDDFGTGYSSLAQLARLPVDIIKVDREFVKDSDQPVHRELLRGIVDLARALDMQTVIEGIETDGQMSVSKQCGATYAQGFLLDRPMDPDALAERLPVMVVDAVGLMS